MPLSYLGDENLPGRFFRAVERHNARGLLAIDLVRVGDAEDLPLGSEDAAILHWIEKHGRILVTLDESTLPKHMTAHLQAGYHVPGIFMIRPAAKMLELIEFLALVSHGTEAVEWQDQIRYVP